MPVGASGYGAGPYGYLPFGGASAPPTPPTPPPDFDLYCFYDTGMGSILTDPRVSTVDGGGQFSIDTNYDLIITGGAGITGDTAVLYVTETVPSSWTLDCIVRFDALPNDFTDIIDNHFFIGATNAAGPCAGLFIAKSGVAYTGGVGHESSGDIRLDSVLQQLPGAAAFISLGQYINIRIAVDSVTSAVYVYITDMVTVLTSGPQLRYVLPLIDASELANPPTDRTTISLSGSAIVGVTASFDTLCMGTGVIVPNLQPIADAGRDQALRACKIAQLDGSGSFDPEGTPLIYQWRIIDGPSPSSFVFEGGDGTTHPAATPTGFTEKFHSASLLVQHTTDPIVFGDVITVEGESHSITGTGTDGNGFYVTFSTQAVPDSWSSKFFKLLRSRALSGATTVKPTFLPDAPGIYRFDLTVYDGLAYSETSVTIVNALETEVPKGIVPDISFLWDNISNFWALVEDSEKIEPFFEGLAQVAAAELLTLWQVDYSKSLRDIQRSFQRKWLHYDLLLPEPLPELTRLRQVRGGISSSAIPNAGISGVKGALLVLSSPVWDDNVTLEMKVADPYTPEKLQEEIQKRLRGAKISGVTAGLYYASATEQFIRLDADFALSIHTTTTLSVFTAGDENLHPSGTAGSPLGTRTYRVERSLEDLDIQEGDVLSVDGVGYLISRVVDDATDPLRYQRLVVQRDLPILPGARWEIPGTCTSYFLDFYSGLVSEGDVVTLEVTGDVSEFVEVPAVAAAELDHTKLALDLSDVDEYISPPDLYAGRLAQVLRRPYIPVDGLVEDVPVLHELVRPLTQEEVLHRNVDYFIEDFRDQHCIRFVVPILGYGPDVWEGDSPPDRMWAEVTFINNNPTIEANFGIPAGLTVDQLEEAGTNVDYLSAVRGLWYSHLNGPAIRNLRIGIQILLGLPFAEEAGTIEEIRNDFSPNSGRILIRDKANQEIVRSYEYPAELEVEINPETEELYTVGDDVVQFAPLVEGAEVIDYVSDPYWFQGLLQQGHFYEVQKFHTFMTRVDANVFNLSALIFAKSFVSLLKPTYTRAVTLVKRDVAETEVSTTDTITYHGRLRREVSPCSLFGAAWAWDVTRSAGGAIRNQYDGDDDPDNADPTFPTPDADIVWAYDKMYYCPEYTIDLLQVNDHPGGAMDPDPPYADPFKLGGTINPFHRFEEFSVTNIPLAGEAIGSPSSVAVSSDLETILLNIHGDPGVDPTDYELVVEVNSSDVHTEAFTVQPGGIAIEFNLPASTVPLSATDSLEFRIRPASGGVARSPNWSKVLIRALQEDYTVGATVPAGKYARLYSEESIRS